MCEQNLKFPIHAAKKLQRNYSCQPHGLFHELNHYASSDWPLHLTWVKVIHLESLFGYDPECASRGSIMLLNLQP